MYCCLITLLPVYVVTLADPWEIIILDVSERQAGEKPIPDLNGFDKSVGKKGTAVVMSWDHLKKSLPSFALSAEGIRGSKMATIIRGRPQ